MTPYRLMLAAVPSEPRARASILVLDDDRQEQLERFAAVLLFDREWHELDLAVFDNLATVLVAEIEKETT